MSTVTSIKSASRISEVTCGIGMLDGYTDNPRMFIWINDDDRRRLINVHRADLLAAVATECGVIVIDRAELPEVIADDGGYIVDEERFYPNGEGYPSRAAQARAFALRDLALAEYLDAHPPVDEAQVEALAGLIRGVMGVTAETVAAGHIRPGNSDSLAHDIIATGKVTVTL